MNELLPPPIAPKAASYLALALRKLIQDKATIRVILNDGPQDIPLSPRSLADALGVTPDTARNWISGQNGPGLDTCVEICKRLNLSLDALFLPQQQSGQPKTLHGVTWYERKPSAEYFGNYAKEMNEIELGIRYFNQAMREAITGQTLYDENRGFIVARRHEGHLVLAHVPRAHEMEARLLEALRTHTDIPFQPEHVLIAQLPPHGLPLALSMEFVSFVAASHCLIEPYFPENTKVIGFSCGYSLLRFAEMMVPSSKRYSGLTFEALVTTRTPSKGYSHHTARSIVSILQNRHPVGIAIDPLLFVAHDDESKQAGTMRAEQKKVWNRIDAIFTTVTLLGARTDKRVGRQFWQWGERDPEMFRQICEWLASDKAALRSVKALFHGHLLREDGSEYPMPDEFRNECYGVDFAFSQRLVHQERPVWLIVSGEHKVDAIVPLLRGQHINRLCTDDVTAAALIQALEHKRA